MSTKAWRKANREKLAAKSRAYYKANPEQAAAASKAWYEANREKVSTAKKAYQEANREQTFAQMWRYTLGPTASKELIHARTMWSMVRRELRK
jgi:hypothetical protein